MLDTIGSGDHQPARNIQSWACPEARSRPGEPSYPLPAGFIRRWLLDKGSSATHHRSGGHQPAHQSMINRRLMIVPPAMPSSCRTEQLDEREKKFLRLLLEMVNMRVDGIQGDRSASPMSSSSEEGLRQHKERRPSRWRGSMGAC